MAPAEMAAPPLVLLQVMSVFDRSRRAVPPLALPLLALALLAPAGAGAAEDPWAVVRGLRASLEASPPQLLPFTQVFHAAGFSDGERERGDVALDLPRCVRWDYEEPYPKSYLLCGTELRTWNPGEPVGHLLSLEAGQPGLDLLLLDVDELMGRYTATARDGAAGATVVSLAPRQHGERVLKEAEIVVSADGKRPLRLAYLDADGNRTSFSFGSPRRVRDRAAFTPPRDVRWEQGGS